MWSKIMMQLTLVAVAVLLGCCSQPSEGLRILAIFPMNGRSHFAMCSRLAKGLAEKGHQVDVYSHFPLKKPVPNYKDFSLEGSMPILNNNMSYHQAMQHQATNVKAVLAEVGTSICKLLDLPAFKELLKKPARDSRYDLVIVETFLSNCFLAFGRHLDIPMVGIMTTSMIDWYNEKLGNPLNNAVTTTLNSDYFAPMNFWQRLSNTYHSKLVSAMFEYHLREQDEYVERHFGSGYPNVIELQKDLDLLLVNMHYSIDGIRPITPAVVPVAGLHILNDDTKLPKEVQTWLDDSKSGCIYFSFGSMVRIETFPKNVIDTFYTSFKNIAPVRVLMKIAKPKELPANLPANVMTQSWFPQEQVFKHKNTKAFVTHGGLMSTEEAIYYGVPLIGIPLFGDQHVNTAANVNRGIATKVLLQNITEEQLTRAIKEVLDNPIYKTNIEELSKLFVDRPMKPLDEAIYWVEYIARHGKRALRSPLVDLTWWQANLLDVYGFVLLIIFVSYYILKQLLIAILKVCFSSQKQASTDSRSVSKSKKVR